MDASRLLTDLKAKTEFSLKEGKKLLKVKEDRLNERPNYKSWTALQCIVHLNMFNEVYIKIMEEAMKSSSSFSSNFSPGFIGNMYAKAMIPGPKSTKMAAAKHQTPSNGPFSHEDINTFLVQQKQILDMLQRAENVNLNTIKLKTPLSKWIKLKLGDVLRVIVYHNERHILQIKGILKKK